MKHLVLLSDLSLQWNSTWKVVLMCIAALAAILVIIAIVLLKRNRQSVGQDFENLQLATVEVASAAAAESVEETEILEQSDDESAEQGVFSQYKYNYSFYSKLIQSTEEIQDRCSAFLDNAAAYKKVKVRKSWKQVRIYSGRQTLALMVFKGKKLCVAFALPVEQYLDSKYGLTDVSGVKRFEETPMLLKLTSDRKLKYAIELFNVIANEQGFVQEEVVPSNERYDYIDTETLITMGLIRVIGQPSAEIVLPQPIRYRYNYSFDAKLIKSALEIQQRYLAFLDNVAAYKKIKTRKSWKQLRIYSGRQILALMLFKGKKLCVAFALSPLQYQGSKYGISDMSEVKRFEETPLMLKLTSARKLKYAIQLFDELAAQNGYSKGEVVHSDQQFDSLSTDKLISQGLVKVSRAKGIVSQVTLSE